MQRLADHFVGDVRSVKITGVDVVDARRHSFTQHGDCRVTILGRPEHARAGKLHGAVAEPADLAVTKRERSRLVDTGHDRSPLNNQPLDGPLRLVR